MIVATKVMYCNPHNLLSLCSVTHSERRAGWSLFTLVPCWLSLWLPEEPDSRSGSCEQSYAAVPGGAQEELHDLTSLLRFLFTHTHTNPTLDKAKA